MMRVEGVEYCATHGGVMVEGTDYIGAEGLGCEYPETESDDPCVGWPLYWFGSYPKSDATS